MRHLVLSLCVVAIGCGDPSGEASAGGSETSAGSTSGGSASGTTTTTGSSESTGGTPTTGARGFRVGGEVIGLQGNGLVLANGGEQLAIMSEGAFAFSMGLDDGAAYAVSVAQQPGDPEQTCVVSAGAGMIAGSDVADVVVSCTTPIRHVVVIGIDGLGAAYLPKIETPVLDGLIAGGPHSLTMQNALPTMSAPNWMSMIAGAGPDQHGVLSNEWEPGDSQPTPTIFAALREQRPAAKIGVFHDWDGFGALVEPGVADHIEHPGDENETVAAATGWLKANSPELLFVHLDLVDHAGHFHGWGGPDYVAAVKSADSLVGQILQAIDETSMRPYTAVIVSADHGGDGFTHGDDTSLERPIPFVVRTPQGVALTIARDVRIWDIAATVAGLLEIEAPASWIGSPVVEAIGKSLPDAPTGTLEVLEVDEYVWVYSDEGSGAFSDVSIWRPVAPEGYVVIGDVAVGGYEPPGFSTLVVRDDAEVVRAPVAFERIWDDEGSLGANDVTIWNPIPPLGYACLGNVAVPNYDGPPEVAAIRCVHRRYLVTGDRAQTWTDAGSLAFEDAGLWTCIPGPEGGLAARTFITRRDHDDAGLSQCWSVVARGN